LRAILVRRAGDEVEFEYQTTGWEDSLHPGEPDAIVPVKVEGYAVHTFLTARFFENGMWKQEYIDRSFEFALGLGEGLVTIQTARAHGSQIGGLPDDAPERSYVIALDRTRFGTDEERVYGWWETYVCFIARLLTYMTAYTMAKGVVITPEVMTRQARRRRERGKEPAPWHIVKVEPKFMSAKRRGGGDDPTGTGSEHSYRYDVMGHLRFGKHKLGDGTYRHTIEWVAPHQRGLQHTRYIPKTYKVEKGKNVSERMKAYWGPKLGGLNA
jgi:hypothetical protein